MKVIKKTGIYVVVGIALLSALYIIIGLTSDMREEKDGVEVITYKTEGGYAYKVLVANKVFISQDFIPAVSGKHRFCNEEDAQKIGLLVRDKLILKQNPSVTQEDIRKLNITLGCY